MDERSGNDAGRAPAHHQKPSIGRIVHFYGEDGGLDPSPAIITKVHSDTMVNLRVFYDEGTPERVTSVPLFETREGGGAQTNRFCIWPPRV